jgi:hypothetical protein
VRQIDNTTWECTACGTRVSVPRGARPLAVLLTLPGRARERVVTVGEEIVHRCTYGETPDDAPGRG